MINYPSQTVTTDCTPNPTGSHYLAGTQTSYDGGAVGATPTAGLATATYALARGLPTTVVDPNGKTTTLRYDSLSRLIKVFKPHPMTTTGYTAATATQAFTDIAATGTPVALTGDDTHAAINLPFAFPFYGSTYTDATVSSNGLFPSRTPSMTPPRPACPIRRRPTR